MQTANGHHGNSDRGNKARPKRHEHNDDQIKERDRAGLEVKPDGGKSDQCQADEAKQELRG
jgi:hypothetical protein